MSIVRVRVPARDDAPARSILGVQLRQDGDMSMVFCDESERGEARVVSYPSTCVSSVPTTETSSTEAQTLMRRLMVAFHAYNERVRTWFTSIRRTLEPSPFGNDTFVRVTGAYESTWTPRMRTKHGRIGIVLAASDCGDATTHTYVLLTTAARHESDEEASSWVGRFANVSLTRVEPSTVPTATRDAFRRAAAAFRCEVTTRVSTHGLTGTLVRVVTTRRPAVIVAGFPATSVSAVVHVDEDGVGTCVYPDDELEAGVDESLVDASLLARARQRARTLRAATNETYDS